MPQRTFFKLPINADEGFPQSFTIDFNSRTYQVLLYVNVAESENGTPDTRLYDLPEDQAYMVMRVARAGAGAPDVIFQRKVVLNLEYEAAELAFVFRRMGVAKANLNGLGSFGSEVIGGIAARWDS